MKIALASAMLIGSAVAFSGPSFGRPASALKSTEAKTEIYTFEKSEEIFAEAQEVSRCWR